MCLKMRVKERRGNSQQHAHQRSDGTKPQLLGNKTVNMQISLAALYEGEGLPLRTDEGGKRKRRAEEGEGRIRAGERKRACACAYVCVFVHMCRSRRRVAVEAQVSVSEHSITSSSKGLY